MEFMKLYVYQTTLTNLNILLNNSCFLSLNFLVSIKKEFSMNPLNIKDHSCSFGFAIQELPSKEAS